MINDDELSQYLSSEILKSIKDKANDGELDQAVKNAVNQCISHVLAQRLNTTIADKIEKYIDDNINKMCSKVLYKYFQSHQNGNLQNKLIEAFEYIYRDETRKFIENNIEFLAKIKKPA